MPSQINHADFPSREVSGTCFAWEHPCMCYKEPVLRTFSLCISIPISCYLLSCCAKVIIFENHAICLPIIPSCGHHLPITGSMHFTNKYPVVFGLISSDPPTASAASPSANICRQVLTSKPHLPIHLAFCLSKQYKLEVKEKVLTS